MLGTNRFGAYLAVEWKRSIKMLPWFLGSILFLTIAAGTGMFVLSHVLQEGQIIKPITVMVVIPEERETEILMSLLSDMDSVSSICRFQYSGEEEARERVKDGEAAAAIILQEHFYEDINTGVNTPATIVVPAHSDLSLALFQELVADGVSYVQTTEAAVYAAEDAWRAYSARLSLKDMGNVVFYRYGEEILKRDGLFQRKILSVTGEYTITEYYFASFLLICLLMCGLNFSFLYKKRQRVIAEQLAFYGMKSWQLSLIKLLSMGMVLFVVALLIFFIAGSVGFFMDREFFALNCALAVGILLVCMAMAALFHVVYVFGKSQEGVLLFFLALVMILCSGMLLPVSYLSEPIRGISSVLPAAWWQQHVLKLLYDGWDWGMAAAECAIIFLGMLLGAAGIGRTWKKG